MSLATPDWAVILAADGAAARPFSASEVSARKARMSASVRAHIEKMQVVRSPTYKKPLPKPHQRRAAKTELVIKEGEDVVGALKKWLTKNAARVMTLFVKWDTDGNGMVDKKEFREACRQLGLESISTSDLDALFAIDRDSWLREADLTEEFYDTFDGRVPAALRAELDALRYRLTRS